MHIKFTLLQFFCFAITWRKRYYYPICMYVCIFLRLFEFPMSKICPYNIFGQIFWNYYSYLNLCNAVWSYSRTHIYESTGPAIVFIFFPLMYCRERQLKLRVFWPFSYSPLSISIIPRQKVLSIMIWVIRISRWSKNRFQTLESRVEGKKLLCMERSWVENGHRGPSSSWHSLYVAWNTYHSL